jgi:hypothetical protein
MMEFRGEKGAFKTEQSIWFTLLSPIYEASPPKQTRVAGPKDSIWALEGLDIPVILRRRSHDGQAY